MEDILFIFGSARGGTTFVNDLMNEWFSVGTGPEGTFVSDTVQKARQIGDLSQSENCEKLAKYISKTQIFEIIRNRWPEEVKFDVSPEDILSRMSENTVASAIYAAYKCIADYRGKARVGNKSPGYTNELFTLKSLFAEKAKYLFVLRDGRDVALSLRHVNWGGNSAYEAAKGWETMVSNVREFEQQLLPGQLLTIKYEDILRDPYESMLKLGVFIGEKDPEKIALAYEKQARNSTLKNNYDKWQTEMSIKDQKIYEAIAGPSLSICGYETYYPEAKLASFERLRLEFRIFIRLVKLNFDHKMSKLPQDKRKWQSSKLLNLFQPGRNNPRE